MDTDPLGSFGGQGREGSGPLRQDSQGVRAGDPRDLWVYSATTGMVPGPRPPASIRRGRGREAVRMGLGVLGERTRSIGRDMGQSKRSECIEGNSEGSL